jgi:hypothetical protein
MSKAKSSPRRSRAIDHAVLPVASLEIARARLNALGFTVAADARHPFGTENACVYFSDGTFLEPLGVAQREDCEATARKGNVFTARDQAYRFRNGENGFSALVFATDDASVDRKAFKKAGISAGKKLKFSRKFTGLDGRSGEVKFRLAFASDLRAPDAFFFTCEKLKAKRIDRSALQSHANGVSGIFAVVLSEQNPTDFQYLLQDVIGNRETEVGSFGMEIAASNGVIEVMTPEGLTAHFGVNRASAERGLRLEGIVFATENLDSVKNLLASQDISYSERQDRIIVEAADGQGAFFAFTQRNPA